MDTNVVDAFILPLENEETHFKMGYSEVRQGWQNYYVESQSGVSAEHTLLTTTLHCLSEEALEDEL